MDETSDLAQTGATASGSAHQDRLHHAMEAALTQYEKTIGVEFPTMPYLDIADDRLFWAEADIKAGPLQITVSQGLLETVAGFWQSVSEQHDLPAPYEDMIHNSLTWLLLHELLHFDLGHFEITERRSLSEVKDPNRFGVITRAEDPLPTFLHGLDPEDVPLVEPCLELQADHDASEIVLDAYSSEGWPIIHGRATAISGMMMLIEREDAKRNHALSSHPKAATRIFQLLGHIVDMPMTEAMIAEQQPEAGLEPRIPSEEEQSAFTREVAIPSVLDALALARIAGAETIQNDLDTPEAFFADLQTAKLGDLESYGTMVTSGGAQWAKLFGLNAKLLDKQQATQ